MFFVTDSRVERVRKKRNVFERAANIQKCSLLQSGIEMASEKMKSMEEVAQEHFKRSGSIRSSVKKSVKLQRQGSDLSDSSISASSKSFLPVDFKELLKKPIRFTFPARPMSPFQSQFHLHPLSRLRVPVPLLLLIPPYHPGLIIDCALIPKMLNE